MEAQTFTIDPASVSFADQVNLTSIDLYFKKKPLGVGNQSGSLDPGISIFIVPTAAGGLPKYNSLDDYNVCRKEFSEIVSSRDATVQTKFSFPTPVPVKTGVEYAIVVKPDLEEGYELWASTRGEINVSNERNSPGIAGKYVGSYFSLTNVSASWQSLPYKNLKFRVNIGRYAYNTVIPNDYQPEFTLFMKNYEFITFNKSRSVGTFLGGEYVYQDKTSADGTCAVVKGTNILTTTSGGFNGFFSPEGDDSYIVVKNGDRSDVRQVIKVTDSDNTLIVDKPVSFTNAGAQFISTAVARAYINKNSNFINGSDNFIVLSESSANSTLRFTNNSIIVGEQSGGQIVNAFFNDIIVHISDPHVYIHTPPGTNYSTDQIFRYTTTDNLNGSLASGSLNFKIDMYQPENLAIGQPVVLMSRSNEVSLRSISSTVKSESSKLVYTIETTNDYTSPQIDYNATDVFFTRYLINANSVNEHTSYGYAKSKHISKKITFANGRQAEDILVYLQAYKPSGTDLKIYVKLYNDQDNEYFEDKDWTELKETTGNRFSSSTNLSDFVEYEYGLYNYTTPHNMSNNAINGIISVSSDSATVTGVGTDFITDLSVGGLIKIHQPLFPEKYVIASISNINAANNLTLQTAVSSADFSYLGSTGLKIGKILYKNQAFQNVRNNNTVRYYNSNMTVFDKYDTFAIKIVFLSDNQFVIPKVSNIRAIGVSA
jgi:hypothetical protein